MKLLEAVKKGEAQVEEKIEQIKSRKWEFVANHLLKSGTNGYYSESACHKRFIILEGDSASISPAVVGTSRTTLSSPHGQPDAEGSLTRMVRMAGNGRYACSSDASQVYSGDAAEESIMLSDQAADDCLSETSTLSPADSCSQAGAWCSQTRVPLSQAVPLTAGAVIDDVIEVSMARLSSVPVDSSLGTRSTTG